MATLEDVRRFIAQHADEGLDRLQGRVAREFGLTQKEAARMVQDAAGGPNVAPTTAAAIADNYVPENGPYGVNEIPTITTNAAVGGPGVGAAALAVEREERRAAQRGRERDEDR